MPWSGHHSQLDQKGNYLAVSGCFQVLAEDTYVSLVVCCAQQPFLAPLTRADGFYPVQSASCHLLTKIPN